MPRRGYKPHNFNVTVVTGDGSVIGGEEWLSKPQVFSYEKNKELCDEYARRVDPAFRAKERAARRVERVEKRRIELEEQQRKINAELSGLSVT